MDKARGINPFLKFKIRHKLMGIYILVVVLPILLVGVYLNNEIRQIVLEQVLQETTVNMNRIEERLYHLFDNLTRVSALISINAEFQDIVQREYANNLEFALMYWETDLIEGYQRQFIDQIHDLRFYSFNMTMLHSRHFFLATNLVQKTPWFQEALSHDGYPTFTVVEDRFTGRNHLTLTKLVKNNADVPLGVLNLYVNTRHLESIFQDEPYEVILSLNDEAFRFENGQLLVEDMPDFGFEQQQAWEESQVFREIHEGKDSLVNMVWFSHEWPNDSEMQITTIIPIEAVTYQTNVIMDRVFWVVSLSLGASLILMLYFVRSFDRKVNLLKGAMTRVAVGDFSIAPTIKGGEDELKEIYDQLYTTMISIQQLLAEVYRQEIQQEVLKTKQKESEFKWLTSQINPHFLYNTLEMIRVKAAKNGEKEIAEIVKKLSRLLRFSLETKIQTIPLKKEIQFITMYLEIQKLRFQEKIHYEVMVEPVCEDRMILPLIIQPLIENAFSHGIEMMEGRGEIQISIFKEADRLVISVRDNGLGISPSRLEEIEQYLLDSETMTGDSIGLSNVHQRIQLYYGKDYGLKIKSEEHVGTTVRLEIKF